LQERRHFLCGKFQSAYPQNKRISETRLRDSERFFFGGRVKFIQSAFVVNCVTFLLL
jgi:hypothetical protein